MRQHVVQLFSIQQPRDLRLCARIAGGLRNPPGHTVNDSSEHAFFVGLKLVVPNSYYVPPHRRQNARYLTITLHVLLDFPFPKRAGGSGE